MSNSSRIAKNTLFLYLRSIVILFISLYTSRIILQALGVEDYGIYNVVGGVISMIGFLNASLTNTYQRYYNYEMGRKNIPAVMEYFYSALGAQFLMALGIFLVAETIGIWFINTQLTIPIERMFAANCVYQVSVLSLLLVMFQAPYGALIISYEKMSVFAYISIFDAVLKLLIVFVLLYLEGDRLIWYSLFLLGIGVMNLFLYVIYCKKYFYIGKLRISWDKSRIKSMFGFAGWNVVDSLASTFKSNGLNMLLNIFCGPVVNAAYGLSHSVMSAVSQFVTSFQMAFRPQLTQLYAANEFTAMYKLLYSATKLSYFLMLLLSLPIIFETPTILRIWLGDNVPEHTVAFVRIVLVISWVSSFANPASCIAQATGQVKRFVLSVSTITIMILPVAWIVLKEGTKPEAALLVSLTMLIMAQVSRLITLKRLLPFSIWNYMKKVVAPCIAVFLFSITIPLLITHVMEQTFVRLLIVCVLSVVWTCLTVWFWGMNVEEKELVKKRVFARRFRNK